MDYDDILEELGEMGRYQIRTYLLVCLPVLFSAASSLTYVFTAGVPDYRCLIPGCDNTITPQYNESFLEYTTPNDVQNIHEFYKPAFCERYIRNSSLSDTCNLGDFQRNKTERCDTWVFGEERTIVNDWNITCLENQWKLSLIGSIHFVGIICGSALFGALADRYGRKLIFILCIIIMSITGVLQVFSPEYITFAVLVFLNAMGTAGVYPLAFIIGVEMVGRKKRELTGMVLNYFYALGEALVGIIALYSKSWIIVQLAFSAPPILFVMYYWLLPESIRWLLARDQQVKARKLVYKVAKVNHVVLSKSLEDSFISNSFTEDNITDADDENKILPVIKQILKCRKLVIRFTIITFMWSVNAFVYYGLSVNSTSMGGDKYLNFILVCLVEIPGYSIAWIAIRKLGRRLSLIISFFLCGLTCTLTIFVPSESHWAVIMLFLIGKLSVTSSFGIIYVYTSEVLPTVIRSGGVGAASTMGRVGALLAPFVPLLGVYVRPLPMLLFGSLGIIAGILTFKLPETLGVKLPKTFEDAKAL